MGWIFMEGAADPALAWFLFGATLITIEALTVPGIGLFLAGLGADATALIVQSGLIGKAAFTAQLTAFFAFTSLFTLLLWRPLQRYRSRRSPLDSGYHNLIGTTGRVAAGGLSHTTTGQVEWSGTHMNAVIDPSCGAETLTEGALVTILSVEGTTLNVAPADSVLP
jgi:membrane protein implicated in regulation of membrane protease activity